LRGFFWASIDGSGGVLAIVAEVLADVSRFSLVSRQKIVDDVAVTHSLHFLRSKMDRAKLDP
jgi:hypothetical protein